MNFVIGQISILHAIIVEHPRIMFISICIIKLL